MSPIKNPFQRLLKLVLRIFLSSTLRSWLALLLFMSCFTCIAISLSTWSSIAGFHWVGMMFINVTILSHHSYVMTEREAFKEKPRFGSLVDFILTTAECTFVPSFVRSWIWMDVSGIAAVIRVLIMTSAILVQAIDEPSGVLTKPFDFYAMTKGDKPPIYRIVSGVAISHDQHKFVPILRRIFTMVIAVVLLTFSFINLVIEPVQEASMTPQKIYTTPTTSWPGDGVVGENWSIVAFARNHAFGDESKLHDAINVNAKWDNENVSICAIKPGDSTIPFQFMNDDNVTMVVFDCPVGDVLWPDVLITVNFTTLGINATFPSNSAFSAVSIVVGMHNDTVEVIRNTWPIPLVPDEHLLGGVIPTIREQFRRPRLASLGIYSATKGFYVGAVPFLRSDPSLQVPRDNNTATLRLYLQDDYSDWHISADYREKSVLSRLAAVGGFWTVLSGLFATIFGTTLLFVLFGTKPLSTFGLIHQIPKFKPVLKAGPDERYRNLLSKSQSDKGMLDYIHDHFVDLSPFEDNRPFNEITNPSTTSSDLTSDKVNE